MSSGSSSLTHAAPIAPLLSFSPTSADYPNHLATPEPERLRLPPAPWLLALLVLLCLAPRAVMALRVPSICCDGLTYVTTARALEAGNFRDALFEGAFNIYPAILVAVHRLGFDWETAAAVWGVAVSTLVILPLWGWARRQFDDRVALAACLLYIVHTTFIIESPEVMRDATFWFLFMLAIYWLWRAVTEVRYRHFMAGGAAITLALLTRVEGLFLLIPLVLWTFWRCLALRTGRRRLLLGATLCVFAFPLLLVLANVVWLYDRLGWTTIRLSPLARVQPWLESFLGHGTAAAGQGPAPPMHVGRMLFVFVPTLVRGLTPAFALLMLGGMWGWRRVWARRDQQALFYTAVVILCGIWVQLWFDNNISRRYPLPIVLMAAPLAALGLFALTDWLQRVSQGLGWQAQSQRVLAVAATVLVLAAGLIPGVASTDEPRRMAADVGRWVRQDFSTPTLLLGPPFMSAIVRYYSQNSSYMTLPAEADDASVLAMVAQTRADVVILWPSKRFNPERCAALIERMKGAGLELLRPGILPDAVDDSYVLVRANRIDLARKPTPAG